MIPESTYIGNELELFSNAHNWKNYYGGKIKPFLNGKVLEVGAGIGSTTEHLCDGSQSKWVCLEPDDALGKHIQQKIGSKELPACCEYINGTLESTKFTEKFNAIIYIDVIEHIEQDAEELKRAAALLEPGGHLIILVPAHQALYSPFDKAIGHFRRYSRKHLKSVIPSALTIEKAIYLDMFGLISSFANKLLLKQKYPTLKQVLFWDKNIVALSKHTDKLIGFNLGKSVLLIAKNEKR